ncbi:MAG: hypothetical protein ACETVR_04340 [Candidatus Bathyarchaeia archaeon]
MERSRIFYLEVFAYMLLIVGTLGDHVSTVVALRFPHIYETNPLTLALMSKGLWLPLDLVLIVLGIAIPYLILRIKRGGPFRGLLAYPLVLGAIRLGACIWNFSLI